MSRRHCRREEVFQESRVHASAGTIHKGANQISPREMCHNWTVSETIRRGRIRPKRRVLRFSVRTVLVVLTIFCVWLGWNVERARKQREAVAWLHEMGGWARYEYELSGREWLREQLGTDFFDDVVSVKGGAQLCDLTPLTGLTRLKHLYLEGTHLRDVTPLAGLTHLKSIDLQYTQVSDLTPLVGLTNLEGLYLVGTEVSDVTPLVGLTNLKSLHLRYTQVSDLTPVAGLTRLGSLDLGRTEVSNLTPLGGLKNLEELYLGDTQVSDVTPLAGLTRLESLRLQGTSVGDVTPLAGLKNLEELYLWDTQVSEAAVEHLRRALPKCKILLVTRIETR